MRHRERLYRPYADLSPAERAAADELLRSADWRDDPDRDAAEARQAETLAAEEALLLADRTANDAADQ